MKRMLSVRSAALGLAFCAAPSLFAVEAYLEGTGSEYINLGYCARPENKAVVHFCYTGTIYSPQQCLFGSDWGDGAGTANHLSFSSYQNGSGCYAFTAQDGTGHWQVFNSNAGYSKVVPYEQRILTVDLPGKKGTLTNPAGTFTYTTIDAAKKYSDFCADFWYNMRHEKRFEDGYSEEPGKSLCRAQNDRASEQEGSWPDGD